MKKLVPVLALGLMVAATPVLADRGGNHGTPDNEQPEVSSQAQPSPESSCDPNASWKNHGEYVSCVAHEHLGGKVTSEAAESNVGKEPAESSSPSAFPSVSPSPSGSPSASPSLSPSPSSSESASPSASPSIIQETNTELQALIGVLRNILDSLQHLL